MSKPYGSRVDKRIYWRRRSRIRKILKRMKPIFSGLYKDFFFSSKSGSHIPDIIDSTKAAILDIESSPNLFSYKKLDTEFKPGDIAVFCIPSSRSSSRVDFVYNKRRPNHEFDREFVYDPDTARLLTKE